MIKFLKMSISLFVLVVAMLWSSVKLAANQVETVTSDHSQPIDLMRFLRENLMLCQWQFWLVVALLLALVFTFWRYGYKILFWYRSQKMGLKVVIAFAVVLLLIVVSCMKVARVGWWFTVPVALSIIMLYWVTYDIVCRMLKKLLSHSNNNCELSSENISRQFYTKLFAKVVLLVWSLGWTLYFIPVSAVHGPHVGAEALFHPAACALQMFAMHMDSFVIDANIINNYDVVKGLISVISFVAMVCTVLAVIGLVTSRLMAYLHLRHFVVSERENHLYVFFGINDASLLLAKSILDNENGDKNGKIVFVETSLAGEKDQKNDTDGWKSIMSVLTHRRKTFVLAKEDSRRALAISNADISSLDISTKLIDVWGSLGLGTIKDMLNDTHGLGKLGGKGKLFVFFLSEDQHSNVLGAINLTHDSLLKDAVDGKNNKFSIDIYCSVDDNSTSRLLKDAVANKKMAMHVLNYSLLAVEGLRRDIKNQPVSFVNVEPLNSDNPGAVSSPFVSLVIGFGETGQQALKFLYEDGAFVSSKSSADNSFRSEFVCHVVDKEMECHIGAFHATHPAVPCVNVDADGHETILPNCVTNTDVYSVCPSTIIKFFNCDYKSVAFYEKALMPIVDRLNYVVVALGDSRINMRVAIEVLRFVRRYRPSLDNFKIFVRGYDKNSYDFIDALGNRYNKFVSNENGNEQDKKIEIFGSNEMICTYNLFVKNQYLNEARIYLDAYNELQGYGNSAEYSHLDAWSARKVQILGEEGGISWSKFTELQRKEGQDRSNAVHARVKVELLRKALCDNESLARVEDLARRILVVKDGKALRSKLTGNMSQISYPELSSEENKLLLNLAITEHIRWVASHEMLGYVVNDNEHCCNEVSKQHNALRPWQELDQESVNYKVNNFGVIETTLKLTFFGDKE